MKALIVDDESRVRKAIRLLVHWEEHGITDIQEADNGLKAIELIQQHRPNLVLLDMLMPLTNGLELMEWIHNHYPDTKFIVISGHDDFEFVRNTILYSGTDYILKPVDETAINAAVGKQYPPGRRRMKSGGRCTSSMFRSMNIGLSIRRSC